MPRPLISLITDFGDSEYLVGSMKGVIQKINPKADIIDITHKIPPYDIMQACYVLNSILNYFPVPTIHLVVVDPGVGSNRRHLIASGDQHYYIAPDNGVLTSAIKTDNITNVYHLQGDHYMLKNKCDTFHGRDVFAPVAAWLSRYFKSSMFGEPITDYKTLDIPKPSIVKEKVVKCQVMFLDSFGNLITNFERVMLESAKKKFKSDQLKIQAGNVVIDGLKTHYFEVENRNEPLALFGNMDLLEISVREGHAAEVLNMKPGDPVYINFYE